MKRTRGDVTYRRPGTNFGGCYLCGFLGDMRKGVQHREECVLADPKVTHVEITGVIEAPCMYCDTIGSHRSGCPGRR